MADEVILNNSLPILRLCCICVFCKETKYLYIKVYIYNFEILRKELLCCLKIMYICSILNYCDLLSLVSKPDSVIKILFVIQACMRRDDYILNSLKFSSHS